MKDRADPPETPVEADAEQAPTGDAEAQAERAEPTPVTHEPGVAHATDGWCNRHPPRRRDK